MAKRSIASTNISIGANLTGLQRGLKIARRSLKNFGASAKRLGSNITRNVSVPFAAAGTAGVKMATDLESSFAKIENLVGITGKALDNFKTSVKGVSAATGQSQQALSEALFTVASAGLRGAEATEVLEASAKASAIGLGDTQQVAQALTGVLQAYAKDGLTAAQATDTLTAIVREGNLEAEALAPTLGRVVGVASQLGISFEEVGANIATFTRLGVPAEEAVVGLRGIMTSFLKPTTDAEKALATLGLTAGDLRTMVGEQGLQSTLAFLMESFKGNDAAIASVFGNVRALSAVLGTAGAQGETYAQVLKNISNSTGIVDEGFKNVSQSSGFKFQQTLNSLRNAGIELGAALLPLVTKIAQFITKAINSFRDLSTETKTAILTLTAIVAAGGPIISAIGFISTALSALLTPTGLIIAGIAAAGYAVYKFWDVIRPVLVKTINFFIDLYNESTLFRGVIIGLKYTISQTFNFFGKAIRAVIEEAKNLGEILMAAFTLDWDRFTAAVTNIGTGFVDNMKAYFAEASDAGAEALEEIFTPRGKIELVTEEGLQAGIDNMVGPLKKMWDRVTGMFTFKGGAGTSTGGGGDILPTLDPSALEAFMYGDDAAQTTQSNLKKSSLAWAQFGVAVKASAEQAAGAITGMVDNVLAEGIMRLGEGLQSGGKSFEDFGTFLLSTFASTAEQLGKLAISVGFAVEGIKKALQSLNPAVAVAAGVALLALAGAARGRMKQIAAGKDQVKLAKGGLAYGETLAVVGDNPNARMDPEVIAPLSKLQSMIGNAGGGRVEVYGRLSGQDILLSTEKANRTRSRYRGF
jgi:TP901 family phage tail tape measure protein